MSPPYITRIFDDFVYFFRKSLKRTSDDYVNPSRFYKLNQKVKRNCIKYLPNTLFPNVPCKHIVLKGSNATIILRKLRLCCFDGITFLRLPNPVHMRQNLNHPSPRQTLPAFVCENVPTRIFWSGNPK